MDPFLELLIVNERIEGGMLHLARLVRSLLTLSILLLLVLWLVPNVRRRLRFCMMTNEVEFSFIDGSVEGKGKVPAPAVMLVGTVEDMAARILVTSW